MRSRKWRRRTECARGEAPKTCEERLSAPIITSFDACSYAGFWGHLRPIFTKSLSNGFKSVILLKKQTETPGRFRLCNRRIAPERMPMLSVLTADQMLTADREAIAAGTPSPVLMARAAQKVAEVLSADFDTSGTVAVFCGAGNNGSDGFLCARLLAEKGIRTVICYPGKVLCGNPGKAGDAEGRHPEVGETAGAPGKIRGGDPVIDETAGTPGKIRGGDPVIDETAMSEGAAREYRRLPPEIPICFTPEFLQTGAAGRICAAVDAMFGIGLSRPVTGRYAECIRALNASGVPVLAVDIPSGVCADNGAVLGCAVKAAETVAISHYKRGHLLYPGTEYCGKLLLADIGVSAEDPLFYLSERADLSALPPRPARSNKGTFGRILILGGSVGMSGAGYLAAKAAYRAGAGLAELFTPARNRTIYQRQIPEAVLTLYPEKLPREAARAAALSDELCKKLSASISRATAVAAGMGLSASPAARELIRLLLETIPPELPLVLDADALSILADTKGLFPLLRNRQTRAILTPHPGEMSRLCGRPVQEILADPVGIATAFAEEHRVILVLKDAHTVVTDGKVVYLNTAGNNGMATAGAGDVLAGVIAAFAAVCGNGLTAARLGVLAHALAGDAAAQRLGRRSVMASDIAEGLCEVLRPIF